MRAVPAWGGRFVPGEPTEITLTLSARRGGEAAILVVGAGGRVAHSLRLTGGVPAVLALPAYPGREGALEVRARIRDGEEAAELVALASVPAPFAVEVANPAAAAASPRAPGALRIPVGELPRSAAGLAPVSDLLMPAAAVAALRPEQTRALADFIAACRPLWLIEASPAVVERVRRSAGCSGRFVRPLPSEGLPRNAARPPALPPVSALDGLLAARWGPAPRDRLALLLLPMPILLAGFLAVRNPTGWLLLVPVAGLLAYAWLIPAALPTARALTWAEMDLGDPGYRFVTLLDALGTGRSNGPLALSPSAGLPRQIDSDSTAVTLETGDDRLGLPLPDRLLQRRLYRLDGTRSTGLRPSVRPVDNGLEIANAGATPIPAGTLLWRGARYATPPLASGEVVRISDDVPPSENRAPSAPSGDGSSTHGRSAPPQTYPTRGEGATGLPAEAVRGGETALLLPLADPIGIGADPRIQATGLLLIRATGGEP
jgi:hypothetical protein